MLCRIGRKAEALTCALHASHIVAQQLSTQVHRKWLVVSSGALQALLRRLEHRAAC